MSLRDTVRAFRFYYKANSRAAVRAAFRGSAHYWWFPFFGSETFTPRGGLPPVRVPRAHWRSLATIARLVGMGAHPEWSGADLVITFKQYKFVQPATERWTPEGMFVQDLWHLGDRDLHGKVVLDVGAFIGDSSIAYAAHGAIVHAFEPVPVFYDYLVRNITLNGMRDRIVPHIVALSNQEGVISDPATVKTLASQSHGCLPDGGAGQEIRVVDALAYLRTRDIGKVDILKMNCEGCEYDLFHDGRLLDELHPEEVALEYHRGGEPIAHLLEAHGYRVDWPVRSHPKGLIFARRI
mgnify:CR=1 FL=1